ncbi:glycine N-methyltransferase [Pectinophora gossypiella]|uniref:glycine N-methyltransferase n=1 Tax=Pectinophora gossypiella TaxID=13191 RepID=UPI00214F466E|nr:glycine N-methyltransferase [Pectinophora gossypiella]XP_049865390.1 glycine N-methyltransferase [Pectinophora gossypiella]XP_049865391.1 glycine N-methyltransferase [Pectinophora gossypiella]XP_049865393.1 glycine N-methyltransferase [Pectinophora gossypiella]XP_049865394.1 glycine N-methyltransferase [Pectinophora gossypiella]
MSADQVFHSRSEGIPSEGVKDQYADGKAARVWKKFIGDSNQRTQNYKDFLIGLLKKHGCKKILDTACGTGIDSMMLVDEGFNVVSIDASDKMLKHALKARWDKRKDLKYDEWVIEEANWETLPRDIENLMPGTQFDAVICLGNSFAHLLDEFGDQRMQRMCLQNFAKCLKPGGLLLIDHRNYDAMIDSGATPGHSIYYNCKYPVDIKTSVLVVRGKPELIALDYCIDATSDGEIPERSEFRLCYYPHKLKKFTEMLDDAFGGKANHHIYADFKPLDQVKNPGFYIHVMEKTKN